MPNWPNDGHNQLIDGPDVAPVSEMGTPSAKIPITVGATSTLLLAANPNRTHAIIQADPGNTEGVYKELGAAAVQGYGTVMAPGAHYEIGPYNMFKGAVYGICASGGMTVNVEEA